MTEHARHRLYQRLGEVLGEEQALTLMEHLPPVGWADVATKQDVEHAIVMVRADMEIGFADVRAEMRAEFADVRAEMRTGFAAVDVRMAELRAGLQKEMRIMTTGLILAMIGIVNVANFVR
jgi:hypothetical protein